MNSFAMAYLCRDISMKTTVASILITMFALFGYGRRIKTDQDSHFCNTLMRNLTTCLTIDHLSLPNVTWIQGQCERLNETLVTALTHYVNIIIISGWQFSHLHFSLTTPQFTHMRGKTNLYYVWPWSEFTTLYSCWCQKQWKQPFKMIWENFKGHERKFKKWWIFIYLYLKN